MKRKIAADQLTNISSGRINMATAKRDFHPSKKGKAWTEDEINILKEMRENGFSVPEIAEKLNRPVSATYFRARKHTPARFERITYSPEEDAILKAGIEANLLDRELLERLPGRSQSSIRERMSALGLLEGRAERLKHRRSAEAAERHKKKGTASQRASSAKVIEPDVVREMAKNGLSLSEIAKELCVRSTRLRKVADAEGINLLEARDKRMEKSRNLKNKKSQDSALSNKQDEQEQAILQAAKSMTLTQASKHFKKDNRTLKKIAQKLNITFQKNAHKPKSKNSQNNSKIRSIGEETQKISEKSNIPAKSMTASEKEERRRMIRDIAIRMRNA